MTELSAQPLQWSSALHTPAPPRLLASEYRLGDNTLAYTKCTVPSSLFEKVQLNLLAAWSACSGPREPLESSF